MNTLNGIQVALLIVLLSLTTSSFAVNTNATTTLSADIYTAISQDANLSGEQASITVNGGVAKITGKLSDAKKVLELIATVVSVQGVTDVNIAGVTVADGPMPTYNDVISAKVRGAIVRNKVFGTKTLEQLPVTVKTNLGIVYLFGMVDNQQQLVNTILVAQKVPGVQRVISEMYQRHIKVYMPN